MYPNLSAPPVAAPAGLTERYRRIRAFSEALCAPLVTEDYVVQSMPDVSPAKWHLAHVSWFFETFVLRPYVDEYTVMHPEFAFLFNSYYVQAGERHTRAERGLLTRPTVETVFQYRAYVDEHMLALLDQLDARPDADAVAGVIEIGLNHEQQHQELMVTDLKHIFSVNPLHPVYQAQQEVQAAMMPPAQEWIAFEEGLYEVGHTGGGFCYDNEEPRHRVFLHPFALASRLVTNGEYLAFMEDGGYTRPELWLSEGWATVEAQGWQAPLYWRRQDQKWHTFTLGGLRRVNPNAPVCHVSYFEADAYARWADARLATEFEWEVAAQTVPVEGQFADAQDFHPRPLSGLAEAGRLHQMYGSVWTWTQSSYAPYPGYKPAPGALGEYNGKFMCNQYVLRGGSCATSASHIRATYRNFFPAHARWQFMGIRLAKEM